MLKYIVIALLNAIIAQETLATQRAIAQTVECDILVVGAGLAGVAASHEALLAGKTVCMTEITDWMGGQISSQGTSALDERSTQRSLLFYPRGYLELRQRIAEHYGKLNPGDCWVSDSCFLPRDGHDLLLTQLQEAAKSGKGNLHWFPSTVIKELEKSESGNWINAAIAIQHQPHPDTPPLNTFPLSQTIQDWYSYSDSPNFQKKIIRFTYPASVPGDWYVIEATETGEIIALADVPYRLGIDPLSHFEPSSSSEMGDSYCTQGFTYTFALEQTETKQSYEMPSFYPQHAHYYSYELSRFADLDLLFTYRRIWSAETGEWQTVGGISFTSPTPGDISMQNWTWGNDYRPGNPEDNLIYTREQLKATGQLHPGGWKGGLRTETLHKGEEHALGFFYWLAMGTTDSQLGTGVKQPYPYYRLLQGPDTAMGTSHGLSKYPYIREGRRIIGRPSFGYPEGFTIREIDISRRNYQDPYYRENLPPETYRRLESMISGLEGTPRPSRKRSTIYPDGVGIGHYAIDFHPCMEDSPPESAGNRERSRERKGAGMAYPFQIPLRAMIPQNIDNLLVAGKSIATSHIASAAYRVHSFEWSSGAAAGITAVFALEQDVIPYQLIETMPRPSDELKLLQKKLNENGNPTAFPNTSIFNESWDDWE
ncbi:FAD-dependent oxidoreductase [Gloeocapsa sp. PCC 73106]|uniref:FAD-dependent oxidoreductase n=1 Tax=Gloeocapsa sp. PCC 73106 TaxID=102232 RepID=UPI0002ABE2A1|nr:FAD-dependent oxidoreductase [Gloeocapsa sp. PCC 73106]ELR97843.1 FAD binding protein [Gloeocapsa sp. PCC 73106]